MPFEAPDWKLLYSSLSRRRRFAFCPVGYYLHYVAGRDGYGESRSDTAYKLYAAKFRMHWQQWVFALFREGVRDFFTPGNNFRRKTLSYHIGHIFEKKFALLENGAYLQDPKFVNAVIEIDDKILSPDKFYERGLYELNDLTVKFTAGELFLRLLKSPALSFRNVENSFKTWQLGGVIFYQQPDLVWEENSRLFILDMNFYHSAQERSRAEMLYKVYINRFMHIAVEAVQVVFFDLYSREFQNAEADCCKDFVKVFQQLSGEAEMWRDALLRQHAAAADGEWYYARKDNCSRCRFKGICPAENGTALN